MADRRYQAENALVAICATLALGPGDIATIEVWSRELRQLLLDVGDEPGTIAPLKGAAENLAFSRPEYLVSHFARLRFETVSYYARVAALRTQTWQDSARVKV